MKDNGTITEYRFFTPADFREEQAYLELRHRQGKAFVGVHNFKYTFKFSEKADMVYVRDFKEDDIFVDDYTDMYEDSGWTFVYRTDENYYFRKRRSEIVQPEELEIFSTNYDRAQYFGKLQMQWMSDVFLVILVAMLGLVTLLIVDAFSFSSFVSSVFVMLVLITLFISALLLLMLYLKYSSIKTITLTDAEKQEKKEQEEELTGIHISPYSGETSLLGDFKPTDISFEEILELKIK